MVSSGTRVPFVDLSVQWQQIRATALPDLERLFEMSAFSSGPWVERFEQQIAEYLGVRHAIAVNSGSSALHLAVIAAGIGRGDAVLVPAHTFIGTIWGLLYEGAIPVLCDVEERTGTIDLADAERRLRPGVKAIMPVHLYGQPADMAACLAFAHRHGLTLIEDVAQAIGARYGESRLGSLGSFGCFSFYPGKNLGAAGEGGLVTCDDAAMAARLKSLRNHAQVDRYVHGEIGYNYRMDGIQGLMLGHKLGLLDAWTDERRAIARRYETAFADLPLQLPKVVHGDHVYHLYVVLTPAREEMRRFLGERGIDTGLHYPVPLHRQPCLAHLGLDPTGYEVADRYADQGLSLPMFSGMTGEQQDRVIDAVGAFFRQS